MKNKKYNLTDIIGFIYISWVLIILIIYRNKINNVLFYFISFTLYLVFIVVIHKLHSQYPENRIILFLKYLYPVIAFGFVYKSIEGYVTVFYGDFLDELLINFQYKILGFQPVLYLEKFINPLLTEIMKFSYFSYYFYVPVAVVTLFFQKRWDNLKYFVFIITFTFYVCYIGFVLFPVAGPRFGLKELFKVAYLKGYLFTSIQDFLMKRGQTIGAAMPSSHLAVAWNGLFLIKKFFGKKPFFFILPLIILMSIAIVYNRYHYFLDGVLGIIIGAICYQTGKWMYRRYNK